MATGSSVIRVSIIGDATGLQTALTTAETSLTTTLKGIGTTLVALGIFDKVVDFIGDSIGEFQRLEDATERVQLQLGYMADPIIEMANSPFWTELGQSPQDVLELAAAFSEFANAEGVQDGTVRILADDIALAAVAVAALKGEDPEDILDKIGRAAKGATGPADDLGVAIDKNVTVTQNLYAILEQLQPTMDEFTENTDELIDEQMELNAEIEKLQANLGGPLSEGLEKVVGFINDEIDAIPHAVDGWIDLGTAIANFAGDALSHLNPVRDFVSQLNDFMREVAINIGGLLPGGGTSETSIVQATQDHDRRNQGSP